MNLSSCWLRLLVSSACLAASSSARSQVLGVFMDQAGENCDITAPEGVVTQCYLLLKSPGVVDGVSMIELAIRGLPDGWYGFIDVCPPCMVYLPSGFGDGANLPLFLGCHEGDPIALAPVYLFPTSEVHDAILAVEAMKRPTDPNFSCQQIELCDNPALTRVCVRGGTSRVNGTEHCAVSTKPSSWSAYKQLYR